MRETERDALVENRMVRPTKGCVNILCSFCIICINVKCYQRFVRIVGGQVLNGETGSVRRMIQIFRPASDHSDWYVTNSCVMKCDSYKYFM